MEEKHHATNPPHDLYQQAIELAYQAFIEPSDDHIDAVHQRLIFNLRTGLAAQSAVTVH